MFISRAGLAHRFMAVVGARVLPEAAAPQVAAVVRFFLSRGWGIGSGGARGADAFALHTVLRAGSAACARSVVFLPGARPAGPGGSVRGMRDLLSFTGSTMCTHAWATRPSRRSDVRTSGCWSRNWWRRARVEA